MSQEAIDREARTSKRTRVLGKEARCEVCGWAGLEALTTGPDGVRCYECHAAGRGRTTTERHHIMGKANDPTTVQVPGNLHRGLSDRQMDWPSELRTNAERDPLVWLAQALRGLTDQLAWWVAVLDGLSRWLASLSMALRERHGAVWEAELGVPSLWEAVGR